MTNTPEADVNQTGKHDNRSGTVEDLSAGALAIGERLRSELNSVPDDTAARLRAIRQAAVAQLPDNQTAAGSNAVPSKSWWVAGGLAGSAAGIALTVSLLLPQPKSVPEPMPEIAFDEMETLQSMEVLEDLEFLAWMEAGTGDGTLDGHEDAIGGELQRATPG